MTWRSWALALHRDVGYFFAGVVVLYAVSGIAVNHADLWNPNFIIDRRDVNLALPVDPAQITTECVRSALESVGEADGFRSFDFPSPAKIKIYLRDGDIMANLADGAGTREIIRRRPLLHHVNMLHLNPEKWWRLFSDLFAVGLVFITLTGLLVCRGRRGLLGRGKWLVGAGVLFPLAAMIAL